MHSWYISISSKYSNEAICTQFTYNEHNRLFVNVLIFSYAFVYAINVKLFK